MRVSVSAQDTAAKRSVLIVEDHPLVRRGFRELLCDEPDLKVCGESGASEEALRLFRSAAPDLVLVDISLPDGSGLGLVENLVALDADAKVLVVSVHDDPLYAERALSAGALGYVNKQEDEAILLQAVRSVLNGNAYVSPAVYRRWPERSLLGG
ncbi:MAG TPA: response regulator transcription factor [Acidobacteriota bacterium]|jgi:DNA-binding NarL/FixJ family response regulator